MLALLENHAPAVPSLPPINYVRFYLTVAERQEPTSALREYIGVSHMAFPLATSFSPTFEDVPSPKYMPSPPSSPATPPGAGDEQGKTDDKGRRLLLHQNPSYQENLRIRQRNLLSTLDHLDAKLEPLLDVDTGKAIPGFPETLRDIDKLGCTYWIVLIFLLFFSSFFETDRVDVV